MKIEDQVCSLEQSKRLNELGIKDNSYFHWHKGVLWGKWIIINWEYSNIGRRDYPAFTVAELGIMLPVGQFLSGYVIYDDWACSWYPEVNETFIDNKPKSCEKMVHKETEARARAALLIWLLESKLIEPKQVNTMLAAKTVKK